MKTIAYLLFLLITASGAHAPKQKDQKMKNKFVLANRMSVAARFGLALAALVLMAIATSSSASPAPEVLLPSSLPYGYSYEEWSAKYWQWTLGQSTNHYELVGNPEICNGPANRVRFPGPSRVSGAALQDIETNHIIVPAETPLFFSILSL